MRIDSNGTVLLNTPASGSYGYLNIKENGGGDVRFGKEAGNSYNAVLGTWTNNDTVIFNNSIERMRVISSGSVTITTTAASSSDGGTLRFISNNAASASYVGTIRFDGIHTGSGTIYTGPSVNAVKEDASYATALTFKTTDSAGTIAERMRIESGGNVRVNFNQSGSSGNLYFQDIDNGASMLYIQPAQYVGTAPYNTNYINAANSSNIGFIAGGSERMRIDSSGNVLMGVTSITDATSRGFGNAFSGSGAYGNWTSWGNGSHTHAIFRNATNIVGTITTSSSATAYNTSSDYRLKEDLQDFAGLDMVSKIPVYDFKWRVDESRSYGVMAHELEEVLPQAVSGEKDAEKMQGVDYSKIVPLLVKSIQELKAEIEELKKK